MFIKNKIKISVLTDMGVYVNIIHPLLTHLIIYKGMVTARLKTHLRDWPYNWSEVSFHNVI